MRERVEEGRKVSRRERKNEAEAKERKVERRGGSSQRTAEGRVAESWWPEGESSRRFRGGDLADGGTGCEAQHLLTVRRRLRDARC